MRILVTGAAGLIGSAVAALLRRDPEVVGIDLRPGPQVDWLTDIRNAEAGDPMRGADTIVHVAGLHAPHVGRATEADFRLTNADSTEALLSAALRAGVPRFVFTSTTSVYGHALEPDGEAAWIGRNGHAPEDCDPAHVALLSRAARRRPRACSGA